MNQPVGSPRCPISGEEMRLWLEMPIDPASGHMTSYGNIFYSQKSRYGMVYPRPDIEQIASFYKIDNYYTHRNHEETDSRKAAAASVKPHFLDRLRIKIAYHLERKRATVFDDLIQLPKTEVRTILDIGAGSGRLLKRLNSAGYSVVGIETDPQANSFKLGLPVYQGTAETIPDQVQGQQFDAVVLSHVLEHCLDPIAVLKNVYQLLRPRGYFICEVPNNDALGCKMAGVTWFMLDAPRHLNFFTPASLVSALEKSDFEVNKLAFRGYCRQFSQGWIEYEANIYDRLVASGQTATPWPKKNSALRAWTLLFSTLFAQPTQKYDSVRAVAQCH